MLSRQNGSGVEAFVPFFMVILLAESKNMTSLQAPVSESQYSNHKPVLEDMADTLMRHIESLPPSIISEILGVSSQLAFKTHSLAFDFPHKMSGYKAIFGFTGEAYKSLKADTLSDLALEKAQENLRIISSVYGILKPFDFIKPYRCEFNKPIAPDQKTPIQWFKSKVTIDFVNFIKINNISEVINLLPGDAEKCLDWKIIKAFTSVYKVGFQSMNTEGKLKTPNSSRLKELRGKMAREILSQGLTTFKDLITFQSKDFIYSPEDSKSGLPVFITD